MLGIGDWIYLPKIYLLVELKYQTSGWGSRNLIWNCDEVLHGEDHKVEKQFGMVGELNKKMPDLWFRHFWV